MAPFVDHKGRIILLASQPRQSDLPSRCVRTRAPRRRPRSLIEPLGARRAPPVKRSVLYTSALSNSHSSTSAVQRGNFMLASAMHDAHLHASGPLLRPSQQLSAVTAAGGRALCDVHRHSSPLGIGPRTAASAMPNWPTPAMRPTPIFPVLSEGATMGTDRTNYDSSICPSLNYAPVPNTIRRGRASSSPRAMTGMAAAAAKSLSSPSDSSLVSDERGSYGQWIEHMDSNHLPTQQARAAPAGNESVVWPDRARWFKSDGQRQRAQAAFHLDSHTIM